MWGEKIGERKIEIEAILTIFAHKHNELQLNAFTKFNSAFFLFVKTKLYFLLSSFQVSLSLCSL